MHEMQTIVTDDRGVCPSVDKSVTRLNSAASAMCAAHSLYRGFTARRSFGAAFAKSLWPLVCILLPSSQRIKSLSILYCSLERRHV